MALHFDYSIFRVILHTLPPTGYLLKSAKFNFVIHCLVSTRYIDKSQGYLF